MRLYLYSAMLSLQNGDHCHGANITNKNTTVKLSQKTLTKTTITKKTWSSVMSVFF